MKNPASLSPINSSIKLSVVIPSYKDPLLIKTIDSLLTNSDLGDQLEIIAVLDGYWPEVPVVNDKRVRILHLGRNRGMREAINAGVSISRGESIMRSDEHCIFGKGFDAILTSELEEEWIVTPRRFFLNPLKWEVMDLPYIDYEKLAIRDGIKFEGQRWHKRKRERKKIMVDETMAMQGSVWVMKRSWWDKAIGELQTEGYGPHYQDSHEMVFKTWKAGGKLMLNKKTWFAHKHWKFPRTHNEGTTENPTQRAESWKYTLETWKDYYLKEIKPKWGLP